MTRGKRPPALPWWEHLEALRLREGWSRTTLANRAGVARSTVDAWKTAPRAPLNTTVTEVADRLGVDREAALRLAGVTAVASSDDRDDEVEDPHDRLERLANELRELRGDPVGRAQLRDLLEESPGDDPDEGTGSEGGHEDPFNRLDRLYREWKGDPARRGKLILMLESAETDNGREDPHDRLERLWREYRDDPGEKGTVLRGLLETWDDQAS